jgi:hypothetical protein
MELHEVWGHRKSRKVANRTMKEKLAPIQNESYIFNNYR